MKIHEYQASQIFKKAGIPVVEGLVAVDVNEAIGIANEIGYPVVLKSQVLVGGRGKAGGIKIVNDKAELTKAFSNLKKLKIKEYPIEKILVVKAVDIKKEFYVGATIDNINGDVVLIASSSGGVEIEEVAKTNPEAIKKYFLHGSKEIDQGRWPEFINAVFEERHRAKATKVFEGLVKVFFEYDCSLAEINPLIIDGNGDILAIDAKINFDENALFRHEDIEALRDYSYENSDEMEARKGGLSFVKLDGDVGCIVNGAGLAMGTLDIIKLSGGNPANFLDVGGSSNPQKVLDALTIILRNTNVKAVLINIFGGITRCDDIAKGILEAKKNLNISVPLVVRLTGTNEKEAKDLLAENNIETFSLMREAVNKVVSLTT